MSISGYSLDLENVAYQREVKEEMEILKIEAGKTCKIDAGNCGYNIEGPALIICIKEKDLVESKPQDISSGCTPSL